MNVDVCQSCTIAVFQGCVGVDRQTLGGGLISLSVTTVKGTLTLYLCQLILGSKNMFIK